MPLAPISLQQLLDAGVHFGHHKRRWNPKMKPYIYGVRKGIHIIDLEKTLPLLKRAARAIRDVVINHGRVLFIGTKRAAQTYITEAAQRCGQFYINHRWLGGMLTNWKTVSLSLQKLYTLEEQLNQPHIGLTKKELLKLSLQRDKLEYTLGGIRNITHIPDILFIIDTNQESIAIQEATKLKIPIVAVVDTNSTPENITYPIPGNDDAIRAIETYCHVMAQAVLDGLDQQRIEDGIVFSDMDLPQQAKPQEETDPQQAKPQKETDPQQAKPQKETDPQQAKPQKETDPQQAKPQKETDPQQAKSQKETDPQQAKPQKETDPQQAKPQEIRPQKEKPQQEKKGPLLQTKTQQTSRSDVKPRHHRKIPASENLNPPRQQKKPRQDKSIEARRVKRFSPKGERVKETELLTNTRSKKNQQKEEPES